MSSATQEFDQASAALAVDGWCVLADLLTPAQTLALARECRALHDGHQLNPAATGADRSHTPLRGDATRWFASEALSAAQQPFADRLDALRLALNRALLLGLVDSESHYAVYAPGAIYGRHLDRLWHDDGRVLSAAFYLNHAWRDAEGGALRLHLADSSHRDVYPRAGTLLLFLSAEFEHEVLPATRQRMSIACWMRQRELGARG